MAKKIKYISLILLLNIIFNNNIISMQASDINKREFSSFVNQENNNNNLSNKKAKFNNLVLLDMPDELLLKFIKNLISYYVNNWDNIFEFDQNFNKDMESLLLTCKKLNNFRPDIINITKRLKVKRSEYLKRQIRAKYSNLSKVKLNSKLYKILDKYKIFNVSESYLKQAINLIIAGADIDLTNYFGNSILMIAVKLGNVNIVKLLISSENININIQNNHGKTALMYAANYGHKNIAKLLIDNSANVNIQDNAGYTALIEAAIYGYKKVIELLVDNNANINLQNNKGNSALALAAMFGHTDIVELLIKFRVNVN